MNEMGEVILTLKLAMNIAPVALYFIILGLVNSQSRVHVVSARRDWFCLMLVFIPVLLWPVTYLASVGWTWPALLALVLGMVLILLAAPRRRSGWVIYNCDRWRVSAELINGLRHLGFDADRRYDCITTGDENVRLELNEFRLLRNVTVTISGADKALARRLGGELERRLATVESVPSVSAAAMLVSGAALLIVPMSMMVKHFDAFVKVVSDLIPV